MLDSGWIAAISSATSAVVVVATAFVSFRQLKHYRNANDIVVYLRLIDEMDSPMYVAVRQRLREWNAQLADPELRARLSQESGIEGRGDLAAFMRFLEHFALLVQRGGIAEEMVLAEYADTFTAIWDEVRESVYLVRKVFGPYTGRAFEHLAMRSRQYVESGRMGRDYDRLLRDERPSVYESTREPA